MKINIRSAFAGTTVALLALLGFNSVEASQARFTNFRERVRVFPRAEEYSYLFNTLFHPAGGSRLLACGRVKVFTRPEHSPNFVLDVTQESKVSIYGASIDSDTDLALFLFPEGAEQGICIDDGPMGPPALNTELPPGTYGVWVGVLEGKRNQNPHFWLNMDVSEN